MMPGWYARRSKGRLLLCKGLSCVDTPQKGKNEPQEGRSGAGEELAAEQSLCDI